MRLLQFAQGVNTALSIADTSRSLVSGRGGSAHSVSELSAQINNVGAELTSEIRGGVAAVRQDIGIVSNMASTILTQQAVLHQEIQQVIHGVNSLNTLIKKHAHVIGEQLRFVIDEPLQNACHQLTDHLSNKGIAATDDEIRPWLRILKTWLDKDFSGMQKLAAISSSEESNLFLSQPANTDNIAFIAGRLHLLFGAMIPEKFLQLPPISLKFYYLIATLYLKTLEKNPHLMAADKAQPICQKILDTLKTYLEFSKFLKDHPEIIQALFDRYEHERDQLGMVLAHSSPYGYISPPSSITAFMLNAPVETRKKLNDVLSRIEEIRLLLCFTAQCVDGDTAGEFTERVLKLESKEIILNHQFKTEEYKSLTIGCETKPTAKEQVRLFVRIGRGLIKENNFWHHAHTLRKQFLQKNPDHDFPPKAPDGTPSCYLQDTADALLLHLIQEPVDPAKKTFLLDWQSQQAWQGHHPGWNTELIPYDKHADVNNKLPESNIFGDKDYYNDGLPFTYSMCILYGMMCCVLHFHHSARSSTFTLADQFFHNVRSDNGLLAQDKLITTFNYYKLFITGRLTEADDFLKEHRTRKHPGNRNNHIVDPYCLLFLVCIGGRWDAFEYYIKQYPLPKDFDYTCIVPNTKQTPLMIAAEHGREDVVSALLKTTNKAGVGLKNQDGKIAAELACEQGFADIVDMLLGHTGSMLTDLSSAAKDRYIRKLELREDKVPVKQSEKNDYEKGLEKMRSDIEASKTKLAACVPAPVQPVTQPAAVATSVQLLESLSDGEETDTEHESDLNTAARAFFTKQNMHVGRATFCHKPHARPHNRPGFRFFDNALFHDGTQRRAFGSFLAAEPFYFKIDTVKQLDNTIRVKLLTGK